nr:PREDICTED: endoplasmic reticulum resident protein 27 [Struthio camelus australis]
MVKRGEAGAMGTSVFTYLFIILLTGGSPTGCAENRGSASHGTAGSTKTLVLLNNTADVEAFIRGAEVAVIGFFQADDDRRDLDIVDGKEVNAEKMSRFIRMNELRLVTEYNPVTAVGLLHSSVQFHLLLITDKRCPEHPERMRRFREAAELFQGKILFVLVDSNVKGNERVVSFFELRKSQLPALAIFHTPDEERDVLPLDEVSIERVQDFCNVFLQRKQKKEDKPDEPEEKAVSEEL